MLTPSREIEYLAELLLTRTASYEMRLKLSSGLLIIQNSLRARPWDFPMEAHLSFLPVPAEKPEAEKEKVSLIEVEQVLLEQLARAKNRLPIQVRVNQSVYSTHLESLLESLPAQYEFKLKPLNSELKDNLFTVLRKPLANTWYNQDKLKAFEKVSIRMHKPCEISIHQGFKKEIYVLCDPHFHRVAFRGPPDAVQVLPDTIELGPIQFKFNSGKWVPISCHL